MKTTRFTVNSLKIGALTTLLAIALPLCAAAPAQATASLNGCIVSPRPPLAAGYDNHNRPLVTYRVLVDCQPGRTVEVQRQFWEEDWDGTFFTDGDDEAYPWPANFRITFPPAVGQQTVRYTTLLPNLDDGAEEMYLRTRFRVTSNNGVRSAWSSWERSSYTQIFN